MTVPDTRTPLTDDQKTRYLRHLLLPEVGEEGQRRLLEAKVLLVGSGGLGSAAGYYLAAAGVGTLGLIDADVVDLSNLQRQILHNTERIGVSKVLSARQTLNALNPDVDVLTFNERLVAGNVEEILDGFHVVLDCADNFATRYLVNDACVHLGIPTVHGSVFQFEGQATVFSPGQGPCYRCLYPNSPPPAPRDTPDPGLMGVLPGVIGLIQATETIKLLLRIGSGLVGRLLCFDALAMEFRELRLGRDAQCAMCGDDAAFPGFEEYESFGGSASP